MAIGDKIRRTRKKLERKTTAKKAKKRARARRIKRGEPEGALEGTVVAGKEAKKLGSQTKEFAAESTPSIPVPESSGKKAGGVLGGIGEGADDLISDVESGELDMFGSSSKKSKGSFEDDLDMDLDDIP